MITTPKYINNLREKSLMKISVGNEKLIFEKFGLAFEIESNNDQYAYTEQYFLEQIR